MGVKINVCAPASHIVTKILHETPEIRAFLTLSWAKRAKQQRLDGWVS
jgi:hypothetical protein